MKKEESIEIMEMVRQKQLELLANVSEKLYIKSKKQSLISRIWKKKKS